MGRYESDEIEAPYHIEIALQLRSIKLRQQLIAATPEVFIGDWTAVAFERDGDRVTGFNLGQGDDARYVFIRRDP